MGHTWSRTRCWYAQINEMILMQSFPAITSYVTQSLSPVIFKSMSHGYLTTKLANSIFIKKISFDFLPHNTGYRKFPYNTSRRKSVITAPYWRICFLFLNTPTKKMKLPDCSHDSAIRTMNWPVVNEATDRGKKKRKVEEEEGEKNVCA